MALSKQGRNFVSDLKDGKLDGLHISDREGLELMGAIFNHLDSAATQYQWDGSDEGLNGATVNTKAQSNGAITEAVKIVMTDSANVPYGLAQGDTVVVTPTGAAAASLTIDLGDGAGYVAWASGAKTFTMVDGEATLSLKWTGATNALVLTMSAPSAGKVIDGTYTHNAS